MKLPFTQGGHQLRRWADFADAAFIGQWALTVQTTHDLTTGRSMFPIFERILADAHALQHHGDVSADPCQLAQDLCDAWTRLLHRAQTNAAGADAAGWILSTDGDIRRLIDMPEKAQKCLSLAVVADQALRNSLYAHGVYLRRTIYRI
eukprot:SAG31_NODE_3498_length_4194_cov_2.855922_2_plen_148_part_00